MKKHGSDYSIMLYTVVTLGQFRSLNHDARGSFLGNRLFCNQRNVIPVLSQFSFFLEASNFAVIFFGHLLRSDQKDFFTLNLTSEEVKA